ncbi:Lon protease, partial [Gardnerella vaginalis]
MTNKIFAVFNNGCMTVISFTSRVFNYFVKYFSSKSVQYFIGLIIGILAIIVLFLPSAYVVEEPGPTQDVLGKSSGKYVINVDNPNNPNNPNKKAASAASGLKSHSKSGKLLLVTVNTSGVPGYEIPNIYAVLSWFDSKKQILPREVLVPVNQNASDYKKETNKQMTSSQSSAQVAALDYAKKHLNVNVKNVKVKMHIDDIGGPSAGMMYALGILNKLTGVDLAGGKTIAGTGTIDNNGKVGAIGGIRLKMISAKRDG